MTFKIVLAAGGLCLMTAALRAAAASASQSSNSSVSRAAFTHLKFGAVKPSGWILE